MAKGERPQRRGDTHYSEGKKSGKPPFKSGDGGYKKPFRKEGEGEGRKPFRERPQGDNDRPYSERKPYRKGDEGSGERKSFGERKPFRNAEGGSGASGKSSNDRKPFRRDEEGQGGQKSFRDRKPFRSGGGDSDRAAGGNRYSDNNRGSEKKPFSDQRGGRGSEGGGRRFEQRDSGGERPAWKRRDDGDNNSNRFGEDRKPFRKREDNAGYGSKHSEKKGEGDRPFRRNQSDGKPPFRRRDDAQPSDRRNSGGETFKRAGRSDEAFDRKPRKRGFEPEEFHDFSNAAKPGKRDEVARNDGPMTLNKYLAHSGVSSRRDAAAIIKEGKVTVNGAVLTEPGYRVKTGDKIVLDGKELKPQRHFVYVLLNKPKDFITTTEDDRGRRTVMELVTGASTDRLYPIGRLDRNTTGVLLLTNDGDLAQKLSHPKYESKKIYQVSLDKDLTVRHFDQIVEGVELEDGKATVDRLAYLDKKNEIGLEIHSGRNRIVRRIFEHLGYDVVRLDRVMYAGLTKKNVSRGKWRFLTEQEVVRLKHFKL